METFGGGLGPLEFQDLGQKDVAGEKPGPGGWREAAGAPGGGGVRAGTSLRREEGPAPRPTHRALGESARLSGLERPPPPVCAPLGCEVPGREVPGSGAQRPVTAEALRAGGKPSSENTGRLETQRPFPAGERAV